MNDEHTTDETDTTDDLDVAEQTLTTRPDLTAQAATVRVVLAETGASAPAMDTDTLAALIVKVLHDSQHAGEA